MNRLTSFAGALALAVLPLSIQELRASTGNGASKPGSSTVNEPSSPYELHVYMRDTWSKKTSVMNPAVVEVTDCVEFHLATASVSRGPILDTRTALQKAFPGASEQLHIEEKYYMKYDEEQEAFVQVCVETALFVVNTESGAVTVEVTEHMAMP